MNGWNDYAVKQEQYRDQLREAEKQRLIRHIKRDDCEDAAARRTGQGLIERLMQRRPGHAPQPCREPVRPLGR
jgi:hypothetical protein